MHSIRAQYEVHTEGQVAPGWHQGILGALSSPSFRLFLAGAFISSIGSWLQLSAVLWFVGSNHSNTMVGFVNMVGWIPCLILGLFAGVMSDRMNRRRMIIACQIVMMFCSIMIGLCIHIKAIEDMVLIVFLGISGVAYAIFTPAWVSAIPFLVGKEKILSGNTLNNMQFNFARFIGPILGGLLLAVTTPYIPFYLNALTFGAFIILILISRAELPRQEASGEGTWSSVVNGFRYVGENSWMIGVLAAICGLSFFGFSVIVLIPSVCTQVLHVASHYYGLLMGMSGLGALAGVVVVASLVRRVGLKPMMFVGALLTALFLTAFALSRSFWLSCVLSFGIGASFLVFNSAAVAALQRGASAEMQGRVTSMSVVAYVGIFPLGGLLLGFLADSLSVRNSLLIGGLACVAVALFVLFVVYIPGEKAVERHLARRAAGPSIDT